MLPYIKGNEVWGIAKIYDEDAAKEILEGDISTSPAVQFDSSAGNTTLTTEGGDPLLVEGVPFLLDHIAIVTKSRGSQGVWDKGGEPAGVLLTNEALTMTEDTKADAAGDKLDVLIQMMSGISARLDQVEKNLPAEPLVTAADKSMKKDEDEIMAADEKDEEDEKKEKMDAKIKSRKDEKEKDLLREEEAMRKDEEDAKYADAQARCESIMASFGKRASAPLQGERYNSYRVRLLKGLQAHSDSYKDIDLASITDVKLLDLAEKKIYEDSAIAARSGSTIPTGQLVEITEQDSAGRMVKKFKGCVGAWLDEFKSPSQRAMQFHMHNNR